jgi:hypothetical protein
MCTGLLVPFACLSGQVKRGGVLAQGLGRLVSGQEDFPEAITRLGLAGPVAGLAA